MADTPGYPAGTGMTEAEAVEAILFQGTGDDTQEQSDDAETEAAEDEDGESEAEEAEDPESTDDEAEDPDEEETEEPDEAPDLFTVKIEGEEKQVTRDELIAGYQLQSVATRRMMAAAEERKALAVESDAVKAERAQYAAGLEKFLQQIEAAGQIAEPDWDKVAAGDPEAIAAHGRYVVRQRQFENARAEQQRVQALQERDAQTARQKAVQESLDRLKESHPEWKDAAKWDKDYKSILAYAVDEGFEPEVINNIYDHRIIKILNKARRFDELQKRSQGKTKQRQGKPLKAGPKRAPENPKLKTAEERFRQAGDIHSAVELYQLQSKR